MNVNLLGLAKHLFVLWGHCLLQNLLTSSVPQPVVQTPTCLGCHLILDSDDQSGKGIGSALKNEGLLDA